MKLVPFVRSGFGLYEFRLCELLGKTPSEIGEIRRKRPLDIIFLERFLNYQYEVEMESLKKQKREMNKMKSRGKIGR